MGSQLAADDPERLGGYWLASRLGVGGQGVVYEAYDACGARVALKVLHRGATPFERERFGREADAARRVASFCTARVVDVGVDGDTPFIVSEYVDGHSLADEVGTNGPLEADAVLRLAAGAATALATIHQADVIHRDLKPGNILLGPDGPRIIDFGIARAPDMSLTGTGALQGTLGYMAPEVLSGQRATAASDIFAWAAVVIFAASGTEPFRGSSLGEVAYRTAALEPDLSAMPGRIRHLLTAALSKDPEQRPDAVGLLTGLIDGAPKAVDPRLALLEAGAQWAAAPLAGRTGEETTEVVPPLGDRAEAVFTGLPSAGRRAAQGVLLRMVVPGEADDGSQDSVRSASRDELYAGQTAQEASTVREVVDEFVAAGILVTDGDLVRPVSAALLPAWRRLHEWAETDRAGLTVLRGVGTAARVWSSHGERRDDLLSGTALRTCLEWLATAPAQLTPTPLERRFLLAARTEAHRAAKRRRRLLTGVAGSVVIALIAGVIAWFQSNEARDRADQAAAKAVAEVSDGLRATQPETAMLLGLASWRIGRTAESRAALNSAATQLQSGAIDLPDDDVLAAVDGRWRLSSDGTRLAAAGPHGGKLWKLPRGSSGVTKLLYELSHDNTEFIVSADGGTIVVGDKDGTYRRISAENGETLGELDMESDGVTPREVTDNGTVLLDHEGEEEVSRVSVVDSEGSLLLDRAELKVVGLSPDGRYYAVCTNDGLDVWSLGSDEGPVRSAEDTDLDSDGRCPRIAFSPDGRFVAVWHSTETTIWDLSADRSTGLVRMKAGPEEYESADAQLRFSSDGRYLLVYEGGILRVSLSEGTGGFKTDLVNIPVPTPSGGQSDVTQIALDERTKKLSYISTSTNQLRQSDVSASLDSDPDESGTKGVAISPDGGTALIRKGTGETRTQYLMDLRTGKKRGVPLPQQTSVIDKGVFVGALSADGRFIAYNNIRIDTDSPDGGNIDMVVKDSSTGRQIDEMPYPADYAVDYLSLSPDGRYLSVSSVEAGTLESRKVQVRDVRNHEWIAEYPEKGHGVFSPDSKRHVSPQGVVLDLETRDKRTSDFGHGSTAELAFSQDGTRLAVLKSSGVVEVWDGEVRERRARMPGATVQGGSHFGATAEHLTFSEDGSLLATSVGERNVQLWDVDEGLPLGRPLGLTGQGIDAMVFNGEVLRSLGGTKVHALDLNPGHLADRVCTRVGRDLTRKEWDSHVPDAEYRKIC